VAPVDLRQLLRRQPDVRTLVAGLTAALGAPVTIENADGRLLHGEPDENGHQRFPVTLDEAPLGWVQGDIRADVVASLLSHLAAREQERRALGAEVLHLYREVNLIYSFSEKLAALLDLERVAQLTLTEARQLIVATDGVIMVLGDDQDELSVLGGFGDELPALSGFRKGHGILGAVVASGVAEIVNDVDADPRRVIEQTRLKALLCAPLTVGEKVIGLIALGSTVAMAYTAAELKLLTTLALQTATAIENARLFERTVEAARERERLLALHREAEVARARLESEMKLAARIQHDLFPSALPCVDGYECAARNLPARRCGGDYYDALVVPTLGSDEPTLLFCVADVSGKGLPAALVMSNMQATLRALLGRVGELPQLAGHASELLYAATSAEKYVTAALVELHPESGQLTFVGAGHLDNLVLRADGEAVRLSSTGPPLGLLPIATPYEETGCTLAAGDTLLLFSDGVTDAQNADGDEFGEARLLEALGEAAALPVDGVLDAVFSAIDRFVDGAPQFDDITLLAVRRRGESLGAWERGSVGT
jgi:sigma-B regulation protein RsbU (phosphoserine phosphatase)